MNRKAQIPLIAFILVGLLVLGGVSVFLLYHYGLIGQTEVPSNLIVESMTTQPSIISNDKDIASANWLISLSANPAFSESLVGTIDSSTIAEKNYDSQYPLTINVKALPQKTNYQVMNTGIPIYYLDYTLTQSPTLSNVAYIGTRSFSNCDDLVAFWWAITSI